MQRVASGDECLVECRDEAAFRALPRRGSRRSPRARLGCILCFVFVCYAYLPEMFDASSIALCCMDAYAANEGVYLTLEDLSSGCTEGKFDE